MTATSRTAVLRTALLRAITRSAVITGAVALSTTLASPAYAPAAFSTPAAYSAPAAFAAPATFTAPATGAYGPDTCQSGYVWREAIPSDHVCVTTDTRTRTAQENALAAGRRNPAGAYGPNTCVNGYVWREAYNGDVVCVTPDRRTLAHNDNAQAASRRATSTGSSSTPCYHNDGVGTGNVLKGSPLRYGKGDSPYLGARWDSCAHTVTLVFDGFIHHEEFHVLVNGKQHDYKGASGDRQIVLPDSGFGAGDAIFAVQSCDKVTFGSDECTAYSPNVKLPIKVGRISQS